MKFIDGYVWKLYTRLVTDRERIQERREIEDEAIRLGEQRRDLQRRLHENTEAITSLVRRAGDAGIGLAPLARLVGISRQTLHYWSKAN